MDEIREMTGNGDGRTFVNRVFRIIDWKPYPVVFIGVKACFTRVRYQAGRWCLVQWNCISDHEEWQEVARWREKKEIK